MGQTYQSIIINAPADKVWQAVRDFHAMDWAPGVVKKVDNIGDRPGDQVGARRRLNDAFDETLLAFSDADMDFTYSIDNGPSPVSSTDVSDYAGKVRVRPVTEGNATFVEWSSSWKGNDEAAAEFCHGLYVALLNEMKESLEG